VKVVVCLKEVIETGELAFGQISEALQEKGFIHKPNPVDRLALAEAIALKETDSSVDITVVSIGPAGVEGYLREGLALGADRAWRVWEDGLASLSPYQKAMLLARAVALLGPALVLTGARSSDSSSGQVGPFLAARLGLPCICRVTGFRREGDGKGLSVTRNLSRGIREKVRVALPAVLTIEGSERKLPYASLEAMLHSQEAAITCLSPADLGVSPAELKNDPTRIIGLSFPRPRVKRLPAPDSSLPAFHRILALLQGGIARRRGEMLRGSPDELVIQLFDLLVAEGIIKPAGGKGR
jgi:electron transfer flavoprotein beta subunit